METKHKVEAISSLCFVSSTKNIFQPQFKKIGQKGKFSESISKEGNSHRFQTGNFGTREGKNNSGKAGIRTISISRASYSDSHFRPRTRLGRTSKDLTRLAPRFEGSKSEIR
ncbi:hypothetical protein AVEN_115379-1 [Araneus ventricosus]|uniref:Uncharacterized protein n=1 Tax=Araneus ventricosus TaxID=182803 RepID=A0A4Y1ZY87_ARAVE|nr:hypothetical protein AVEN_115379-1 [Araneus ventricosus]